MVQESAGSVQEHEDWILRLPRSSPVFFSQVNTPMVVRVTESDPCAASQALVSGSNPKGLLREQHLYPPAF